MVKTAGILDTGLFFYNNNFMRVFADLHIHSRFSRSTSNRLTLPHLEHWARIKGLNLVGTGDCTHPEWLMELREQLTQIENGLYKLKNNFRNEFIKKTAPLEALPAASAGSPCFVLTGEISTIYKKDGRTRKIHHVVILSSFTTAAAFQAKLKNTGNISSDGRPILGIDSRDLLSLLLDADPDGMLIPAHIWTPWFSVLGAQSGFNTIDDCYADLAPHITAVETGLSSNPPMNWAVPSLARFSIVSNSDAHSPEKLAREATIFDMEMTFAGLAAALRGPGVAGTVEFFPQEGKYHYDGHRNCGVYMRPDDAARADYCCPKCGKPFTRGVMGRVMELAGGAPDETAICPQPVTGNKRPYYSLVALSKIIAEIFKCGSAAKKVRGAYNALIETGYSELSLLMDAPLDEIEKLSCPGLPGELFAQAIDRMRRGKVSISPGYDGKYGEVTALVPGESMRY
jgi:uncharacterized protein (TIGR00375 family)